ncbi:hypothetical protein QQ045_005660 [Rhodiola kirilowii]
MATSPSFLSSTASSTSGWLFKSAKPAGSTHLILHPSVILSFFLLSILLEFWVLTFNCRYKVFYPTMYAIESENKDAKLFNCVQRGHQNSLEMMPMYFMLMILGGIKHPFVVAGLGLLYVVSRYFYFTGYATGEPENRLKIGKFGFLAIMGLMICTISMGFSLIRA